jgi:hypothetical protein
MRNAVLVAVLALGVAGCEVIDFASGVGAALIEGEHYDVSDDGVTWVSYSSFGGSKPVRREQRVDADARTFEVAEDPIYGTDARRAYCKAGALEGSVPNGFRILSNGKGEGSSIATDGQHVWLYCDQIAGADGATFRLIGGDYGADETSVWLLSSRIDGADPASFRILDVEEEVAVDARAAYAGIFPIPTERPADIRSLGAGYSTDGVAVYWRQYRLDGADPGTFEVRRGERFGRDRSGCWTSMKAQPCLNP